MAASSYSEAMSDAAAKRGMFRLHLPSLYVGAGPHFPLQPKSDITGSLHTTFLNTNRTTDAALRWETGCIYVCNMIGS